MIRATPASALNDPFEGRFNEQQLRDVVRNHDAYYRDAGKNVWELEDSEFDGVMGAIQEDFHELGIISFTEDYTNPLMWSHYANEHKGVVVEFDFSQPFFMDALKDCDGKKSRFGKCYLGEVYEFPQKVSYRREIPAFNRGELSNPDSIDEYNWIKFNHAVLFTKANDWIYEKEQRSIVRLRDADCIICNDDPHVRSLCARDKDIKLTTEHNGRMKIVFPREYEIHEEMRSESLKDEIYWATKAVDRNSTISLFRINNFAISGFYFGCRSNFGSALDKIKSNPSLQHIENFFVMRVNNFSFQLDATEIK